MTSLGKVTGLLVGALGVAGVGHQIYCSLRAKADPPELERERVVSPTGNILACYRRPGLPGGPTMLLEAGHITSAMAWRQLLDHLDPTATVVIYDRAGYRNSLRRNNERYCIAESVTDLVEVLTVMTEGPTVLVGHSLGGYLVQRAAREAAERTAGIILLDPMHPRQLQLSRSQRAGATQLDSTLVLASTTMLLGGGALLDKRGILAFAQHSPYRQQLRWELSAASTWRTSRREWSYVYPFMLDGGRPIEKVQVPVSVIAAGETREHLPEQFQLYEEYVEAGTGGEITTVEGSSHLSLLHDPEHCADVAKQVTAIVDRWTGGPLRADSVGKVA
ncbi:alpha/beta fold hydrolase [Micromonospora sp. NPDC007208]|uniref:alpha/beta fold hydrolase n=1 Tax=unclassified Micromonospora TaxID=2617518 RepID=UPI0036A4CEC2